MKTNECFIETLKENGILENITPLETYKGVKYKMLFRCNKCGHEWRAKTGHIIEGFGCPKCRNNYFHEKYAKTHEQFINDLTDKGILSSIEVLGKYYANDKLILVKCKKCGYQWESTPSRLLSNRLCKKCANEKRKKDNISFILELKDKGLLDSVLPMEEYKGCKTKMLFKCLLCGHEWYVTPDNILQGKKCPICKKSKLENDIEQLLNENNITYIKQYSPKFLHNGKSHLVLDFYLPNISKAIECQGKQHFYSISYWDGDEGLKKRIERDEKKYELCKQNGIDILYYVNFNVPNKFNNHQYLSINEIIKEIKKNNVLF